MIEIIKEYLTSIGFAIDKKSFEEANKAFNSLDKTINAFKKGFAENKAVQEFGKKFDGLLGKLGESVAKFATTTEGLIVGVSVAATGALAIIGAALWKFMDVMGKADMQVQIFARRMFTTVENARSLKTVMDTMGLKGMEDLKDVALNPELRNQFMELRKLTAGLELDEQAQEGMRDIRALNLEFMKFGVVMNYFWMNLAGHLGRFMGTGIMAKLIQMAEKMATVIGKILPDFSGLFKMAGAGLDGLLKMIEGVLDAVNALLDTLSLFLDKVPKHGAATGEGLQQAGDTYHSQANALDNTSAYTRKIYELLSTFWNFLRPIRDWVRKLISDIAKNPAVKTVQKVLDTVTGGQPAEAAMIPASGTGGGQAHIAPGVKLSGLAQKFITDLQSRFAQDFNVTSGIAGRSGPSNHPKGRAIDIGLAGRSDDYILALIKSISTMKNAKLNLEVLAPRYRLLMDAARMRGIATEGITNQRTRDWSGEHAHINLSFNIHGAGDAKATAEAVYRKFQRETASRGIRGLQGGYG